LLPQANLHSLTHLQLIKGDAQLALGHEEEASTLYRAIAAPSDDDADEIADLAAIAKLRLSGCSLSQGNKKEAQ
jgi:hypothetical protein